MKPNFYKSFALIVLLIFSQAAISGQSEHAEVRAFYGDKKRDKVVVIDVKRMKLIDAVATKGKMPYPVDRAGNLDKVYAITRGSKSMDVIDAETLENVGQIRLKHKPRSGESYNSRLGLALIAGADKPLTSVIDVMRDRVVAEAGGNTYTTQIRDNGGTISSGHPAWLTKDRFVVIDRANRLIQLWGIEKIQHGNSLNYGWEVTLLDEESTPTSVHHIIHRDVSRLSEEEKHTFYALAEGSAKEEIHPAILELKLSDSDSDDNYDDQLTWVDQVKMDSFGKNNYDAKIMSSHHADCHPDGVHIYAGSTEGHLFVINRKKMEIEKVIKTGKGTGHTRFVPDRTEPIAIVTNHKDTFVTIIDTKNHKKIKDITVSGDPIYGGDEILQSHTNYISSDSKFYYAFASDNGIFYELDLEDLSINRTLHIKGAVPVQGCFMSWDDFSYSAAHSSGGM
ncbi:MAG: hypothetical protein GQ583_10230 [Methyloprofundus sp.]|nr:hypothetical protein [Methyloprofundus sp.]